MVEINVATMDRAVSIPVSQIATPETHNFNQVPSVVGTSSLETAAHAAQTLGRRVPITFTSQESDKFTGKILSAKPITDSLELAQVLPAIEPLIIVQSTPAIESHPMTGAIRLGPKRVMQTQPPEGLLVPAGIF